MKLQKTECDKWLDELAKADKGFKSAFLKGLQWAKMGGEALLRLQDVTGKRGEALFALVQDRLQIASRSCYLYMQVAKRWNELQVVAGDHLDDLSLNKAVKLLQAPKAAKGKVPSEATNKEEPVQGDADAAAGDASPQQQESVQGDAEAAADDTSPQQQEPVPVPQPDAGNGSLMPPDAVATMTAPEPDDPIRVALPFDQPQKDRLATVFASNGPASTPIQVMTNVVIPGLKRVVDAGVTDNDRPFLANAVKEALALIEALRQKYAL